MLASNDNDVKFEDIARLSDVFYIDGTRCGALFVEAVVISKHGYIPHIFTMIKQHGALLAKGRITALQFDVLFTDDLYYKNGKIAIDFANLIREALYNKGYEFAFHTPINKIFIKLNYKQIVKLEDYIRLGFWENLEDGRKNMRIATSWATTKENIDKLISLL